MLISAATAALDVPADPKLDGTDTACDALSIAFGFTASPAQLAEVKQLPATQIGCVSEAGAPFRDQCP